MPSDSEFSIPEISQRRLERLIARVRPVAREEGVLRFLSVPPSDPRTTAFPWNAEPAEEATHLEVLQVVKTLHTYSYYGFFKPSFAEVFSQMPEQLEKEAVAFECVGPKDCDDMGRFQEEFDAGFHVAQTTFYKRRHTPSLLERLLFDE